MAIAREMGRLSEAMDRAREDRAEMKESFSKLHDGLDALRTGLNALNQTMQSTSSAVATISLEKCGDRLDKIEGKVFSEDFQTSTTRLQRLETTVNRWEKWIGEGWSFFGRLMIAIIASGVLGGTVFGFAQKLAAHL